MQRQGKRQGQGAAVRVQESKGRAMHRDIDSAG